MLCIVIPFYKLAYFEDTLNSLANQTNKNFKVYVGDDASTDDCSNLLKKMDGKFDFEYHRFETNLGSISLTKQWDRCIDLSNKEEWIMILGDDDFLGNNVVESFYAYFKIFSGKTSVVRFATQKVFDTTITDAIDKHPVWEEATDAFYRKFSKITRSSLSEYIFTRTAYLKYGFYDYPLAWNSDDKAWLDFSDNKPIFSINESAVFFRLSLLNISGKRDNLFLKNKSEIEFYKFLIHNKLKYYNNEQKLRLLRRYQAEMREFKTLSLLGFCTLLFYYMRYLNLNWIKKFFKKVINFFKINV